MLALSRLLLRNKFSDGLPVNHFEVFGVFIENYHCLQNQMLQKLSLVSPPLMLVDEHRLSQQFRNLERLIL